MRRICPRHGKRTGFDFGVFEASLFWFYEWHEDEDLMHGEGVLWEIDAVELILVD